VAGKDSVDKADPVNENEAEGNADRSSINLPLSASGSMARLDRTAGILLADRRTYVPRQRGALTGMSSLISAGQPCERRAGKQIRAPARPPRRGTSSPICPTSMKPDPRPRIYKTKVSGGLDSSMRSAPVSTLWCRRYHRAIASSFRTWFNRPSDTVRPTTRSPEANRGRHRLRGLS
jgi:hypothetical protein